MNNNKHLITGAIIAAGVIFLIYTTWLLSRPTHLEIQGQVEATQMKISSKVTGRIDSLAVKRGSEVKKGDLLFTIESPEVEAKLNQAEAARLAAEAMHLKAEAGAQKEDIQAAYNVYLKASAALEYAEKSNQRIQNLFNEGVVPAQKRDEMEMQLKVAKETAAAAKAIWEKAKGGARIEDKAAAEAMVKKADAVIAEVHSYLVETRVEAPFAGEVANLLAERGELTPAGFPVITLVDLNDIWFVFNLREDLLADIRKGSIITAKIPALSMQEVELQVSYIAPLGEFATWNATKTSGDFDMKTFEVQARPTSKIKDLRPGMSALVDWRKIHK
ncbi:HlyD family secretion protein [Geofilum sp. OHC36d9]|uniref:HlyD family secretion protein n=1 Tax=Geofilum sp. OHC36d9 TaxID=3458413 RepID=UPI004033B14B